MITLKQELNNRELVYNSIFTNRAEDVYFKSIEELCFSIGYTLKHVRRVEAEVPVRLAKDFGYTIYGDKQASQYRIYYDTIVNMPPALATRLQCDDKMRITGSLFVEACMYLGFLPDYVNESEIEVRFKRIFSNDNETQAFNEGYNS